MLLPAGLGRISFAKFVVLTLAGSIIWNALLVYVGMQLGSNWKNIEKYSVYLDVAAAALVVFVVWYIRSKKQVDRAKIDGNKSAGSRR